MTASATAGVEQQLVGDYVLDTTHSRLGFTARHAMVTRVRGQFREFEGRGHLDPDPAQDLHRVRHHLNARANALELGRLLVDPHVDAGLAQSGGSGQSAHACADDRDRW